MLGDAYSDMRFNPEIDRHSGFRTRSVIAAPLRHVSGRILGVVEVLRPPGRRLLGRRPQRWWRAWPARSPRCSTTCCCSSSCRERREARPSRARSCRAACTTSTCSTRSRRRSPRRPGADDLVERDPDAQAMAVVGAGAGCVLLDRGGRATASTSAAPGREEPRRSSSMKMTAGQGIGGPRRRHRRDRAGGLTPKTPSSTTRRSPRSWACRWARCSACRSTPTGKTLGALELLNKKGGFDEADERLAMLLAGQRRRGRSRAPVARARASARPASRPSARCSPA